MQVRQHKRLRIALPCQVALAAGVIVAETCDISEGGLAFRATDFVAYPPRDGELRDLLPQDEPVQVELPLPDGSLVVARARVRWVGTASVCGVQFESFVDSGHAALVAFVRRALSDRGASLPGSPVT